MDDFVFSLELSVRDYECDLQGIVNNAVYQNYLEHTRHEYLKNVGLDFKDFTDRGINLVVVRMELDYKYSLTSGDQFVVRLNFIKESKVKFAFLQNIYRLSDDKLMLQAKVLCVAVNSKGRPFVPEEFQRILDKE
ncbi:MAG: acyl-CoA thioesterase [Candidatus Electrothrix scaldis]|nr:MAG: acyl-CoA thioesterase [Candidatus Electrothrix sp. GW3-3]